MTNDPAATLGDALDTVSDDERVGVVFVHGVGEQPQSSTVREFSQPLIEWVDTWHRSRGHVDHRLLWSRLSYGASSSTAAKFALHIPAVPVRRASGADASAAADPRPADHPPQTWILAEAWWAARLMPPTLVSMVTWTTRTQVSMFVRLLAGAFDRLSGGKLGQPQHTAFVSLMAFLSTVTLAGLYAIAVVLAFPLLLVLAALARIPVPAVQNVILLKLLQPLLVLNIGDFYTYVYDQIQALHIRDSLYDAICELVEELGCARVVVLAHSQGTVVAYDALSADLSGHPDGPRIRSGLAKVTTLITVGGALNNAWHAVPVVDGKRARPLFRGSLSGVRWLDVWADHDPVPGGPLEPPHGQQLTGVHELQAWNDLNVLRDHGGYFHNPEQFISRVAQEIDVPGQRQSSRFFPGRKEEADRGARREFRLALLVSWRTLAIAGFFWVLMVRYLGASALDMSKDGQEIWTVIKRTPLVGQVIGVPTAAANASKETGRAVAQAAAFTVASRPSEPAPPEAVPVKRSVDFVVVLASLVIFLIAGAIRTLFGLGEWLLLHGLALAALWLAFFGIYALLTAVLFGPWHRREGRESARSDYRPGSDRWQLPRWAAVTSMIIIVIDLFTRLPSFDEVRMALEAAIARGP